MKTLIFKSIMKFIFFSGIIIFILNIDSCLTPQGIETTKKLNDSILVLNKKIDSIKFQSQYDKDSICILNANFEFYQDSINILTDSVRGLNKDIEKIKVNSYLSGEEQITNRFTLIKIKDYIKICEKNPKNNVFFKGWIVRAMRKFKE